jgi:hypothetical protein
MEMRERQSNSNDGQAIKTNAIRCFNRVSGERIRYLAKAIRNRPTCQDAGEGAK